MNMNKSLVHEEAQLQLLYQEHKCRGTKLRRSREIIKWRILQLEAQLFIFFTS